MEMNLDKEYRLKYKGFEKETNVYKYISFQNDGSFIEYLIKENETNFQILDRNNILLRQYDFNEIGKKSTRVSKREIDEIICEYLNIDFNKYKYILTHIISKDELLHYMAHNSIEDDLIQIPIERVSTPNSNYSHSDIFNGFLNISKDEINDDFNGFINTFLEHFIFTEKNKIDNYNLDEFLYLLTGSMASCLTDDELKKFNFFEQNPTHFENTPFNKSFNDEHNSIDFEYKPILEDIQDDIEDREAISYEYKFVVTPKPSNNQHNNFDPLLLSAGGAFISSALAVFAMKKAFTILKA
ncbi:hypothetical protein KKG81_03435 [bacterium]|nr:hypothetical protein [bacterium]